MICRKRPRTDETHIATNYVPELRQLVKAGVPHEISDDRQHPWVVRELEKALPFRARLRITAQILLQPLFGVSIHRAKLQHPQCLRVAPDALLNVDRGTRIDELNGKRKNDDDRPDQQRNGDGTEGPSWVAAIVNAVGQNTACDGVGYWQDTAVLVVWDDWGGWYDHVPPFKMVNDGVNGSAALRKSRSREVSMNPIGLNPREG